MSISTLLVNTDYRARLDTRKTSFAWFGHDTVDRLIDANDESFVWSERYDREMADASTGSRPDVGFVHGNADVPLGKGRRPGGRDARPGLNETGVVVINPPYVLAEHLAVLMPALCTALAVDGKGGFRIDDWSK